MTTNAIAIREDSGKPQGSTELPPNIVTQGRAVSESWISSEFPAEGNVRTGIWVGEPCTIDIPYYPHDEIFTVLSGAIEMTNADGSAARIGPGQSGLVRKGWKGTFRVIGTTKKCFVDIG